LKPIKTRVAEMLGIDYPIIQGGMVWAASSDLVAAVSEAGGFGLLGSASMYPDHFRNEIRRVRQLTNKPFGANISLTRDDAQLLLDICIEEKVTAVSCSLGNPAVYVDKMKAAGIITMHVVTNLKHALKAQTVGADMVIAVGVEAGGHPGPDEMAVMTLVPQLVDALDIPVIAAGGIVDGRGLAAAMALGAEGVQVGTRFLMTTEATVHEAYKQKIMEAGMTDTILVAKKVGVVRMLKTPFALALKEAEEKGASAEELHRMLRENRPKFAMVQGDVNGQIQAGQGVGMINDIVPAAEVIRRMVTQYEDIVQKLAAASQAKGG